MGHNLGKSSQNSATHFEKVAMNATVLTLSLHLSIEVGLSMSDMAFNRTRTLQGIAKGSQKVKPSPQ